MENKYYTPDLEELHINFECELRDNDKNFKWFPVVCTMETPFDIDSSHYSVRVKYLDREDIESLGWNYDKDVQITDLPNGYFGELYIMPTAYSLLKQKEYIIIKYGGEYIFKGIAKNKSELKKIMQQLNIK